MSNQFSRVWQSFGSVVGLTTLLVAGLAGVVAGCSFDGSLRDLSCDQEGERLGEKVCRNGTWVRPDAVEQVGSDAADGAADTGGGPPDSSSMGDSSIADSGPMGDSGSTGDADAGGPDGDACTGGTEVCDGVDNDCDGEVDEECGCTPGETQSCYSGPMGSVEGICQKGTQTCRSDRTWGDCQGEVTPKSEMCGDNKDSDCNGATDNGCACDYKGKAKGVCQGLTRQSDGSCPKPSGWEAETAKESACDKKDNDCDGVVDEGCPCDFQSKSEGVCQGLTRDAQGNCPMPSDYDSTDDESSVPLCDQKDNDCDGTADENCGCTDGATQSCGKSTGVCTTGTQTCSNGQWGMCQGGTSPSQETCNGKDDDCDGQVDENLTRSCGTSTGVCTQGTATCSNGQWGMCQGGTSPGTETCNNKDDDCDGQVDENVTRSCGTSTGACMPGTESCSMGQWGSCQGGTSPTTEKCNDQVDSDCNGADSNGCPCNYDSSSQGVCGTAMRDSSGSCQQPTGYEQTEMSCSDGLDNDCDGSVDKNDADCQVPSQKAAGSNCAKDSQCISGNCVSTRWRGDICAHRIVVTSKTYDGKLGGASGADRKCQKLVGAALGGSWKAVVSVQGGSARRRLSINAPIFNANGDLVASGGGDLWDARLNNAVEYDEKLQSHTGQNADYVWTATQNSGAWDGYDEALNGEDCNSWGSNGSNALGEVGRTDSSTGSWSIGAGPDGGNELYCNKQAVLYCLDGQ